MTLRQCELTNGMKAFCQVSSRQTCFHLHHQLSVSKDLFSQLWWSSQIRLAWKRPNIKQVRTNSGLANSHSKQQSQQFLNCNMWGKHHGHLRLKSAVYPFQMFLSQENLKGKPWHDGDGTGDHSAPSCNGVEPTKSTCACEPEIDAAISPSNPVVKISAIRVSWKDIFFIF